MPIIHYELSIKLPVHLKTFLIDKFGEEPVFLPKQHDLNSLLSFLVKPTPKTYVPQPSDSASLRIRIPFFNHKNPAVHNYLSPRAQVIFEKRVRQIFYCDMIDYASASLLLGLEVEESLYMYLESHNIEITPSLIATLKKKFYRNRKLRRKVEIRAYNKNNS